MKVFISHKREDAAEAERVARLLRVHDVETYLDILDPVVFNDGKSLTDHIKKSLNSVSVMTRMKQSFVLHHGVLRRIKNKHKPQTL